MRRNGGVVLAGLLALLLLAPAAGARGLNASARERSQHAWDALRAKAIARAQHPVAGVTLPGSLAPAVPSAWQRVRGGQQISQDNTTPRGLSEPDTQAEPFIAMDPNNDQHVVAVMQQGRFPDGGSVGPGYATSQDGGRTWVTDQLNGVTIENGGPWDRASDPWVAFGPNGVVYAQLLVFDETCPSGIDVIRSDDGGITWNTPVDAQNDTSCAVFNDKQAIAVDTNPSSPFFGRVYIAWDRLSVGAPIVAKYSDDQGQTWSSLITVSGSHSGVGAFPLVQPNGNVTVVYVDSSTGFEVSQTSTNGGVTWGPIVNIGQDLEGSPPDQRVNCGLPTFAIDPVTSFMYVAWCDIRLRSDGLNDIIVWKSTNGGTSWTGPVKVNPDPSGSGISHLNAGIAAYDHVVHVFYYTRQKIGANYSNYVAQAYSHSEDDGVTYGGEISVGPRADLRWAAEAGGLFLGDYIAIAASGRAAHPVWCRSSRPPQTQPYHQTTWSAVILP
jgi:hypothetical protein